MIVGVDQAGNCDNRKRGGKAAKDGTSGGRCDIGRISHATAPSDRSRWLGPGREDCTFLPGPLFRDHQARASLDGGLHAGDLADHAVELGIIGKKKKSAFFGTPLLSLLIDRRVDTCIIVGGSTSNCIRATAIDSEQYNFFTIVPEEAVYDRLPISHKVNLFDINRSHGSRASFRRTNSMADGRTQSRKGAPLRRAPGLRASTGTGAMSAVDATSERWNEPNIHRIAGEIALMSPESDAAKAEAYFGRALEIARAQQARSWELRAATSLARLWRDQDKRQQARDLLAPVYGWFTEGFDTLDLKEAKALMEELA